MYYIQELSEGQHLVAHYYCQEKTLCRGKTGKEYLSLVLRDKTGTASGKIWDLTPRIQPFDAGDFVKIEAQVVLYKGEKQINIVQIRKSRDGEYDPAEYSPVTEKDPEAMYGEIKAWIEDVHTPYLKKLLEVFYLEDQSLIAQIRQHPAAKSIHHSFVGGYLEHVTSVTRLALFMARGYGSVDVDMVAAAALLHDIGKLRELAPMPDASYTFEGQMLGHIAIGFEMVHDQIALIPGFPPKAAVALEHAILSHHGELEFGSPKVPVTVEALIVNLADNADAKIKQVEEFIAKDENPGEWTGRNMVLARNFYKGSLS